jgi:peptidoglycan-associated lipoprotein
MKRCALLMLTLILTLGVTGCSRTKPRNHWWQFWRPKATETSVYHPDQVILPPAPDVLNGQGNSNSLPPGELPPPPSADAMNEPDPMRQAAAGQISELQTVYFDYDSADLSGEAIAVLDGNAGWLMAHANFQIQIEGHCDERGTVEYNLNLGDRRAKAVKAYLASKGVAADNLHTISYGEERPQDPGNSESSWGKNRRVQFLVY